MEKIHNNLMASSEAYANWHEHPHHKKVHWGAVVLVALGLGLVLLGSVKSWRDTIYNVVLIQFSPRSATLALDPTAKEVKVGDTFSINIVLDTDEKPVDGVDIYSLHYNPAVISVVDDSSSKSGVQITAGTLMASTAVNTVDAQAGTIKFSQASLAGTNFTGKGVLATINFKAVSKGTSPVQFDFKLGSTIDTNVAHAGRDSLSKVVESYVSVTDK